MLAGTFSVDWYTMMHPDTGLKCAEWWYTWCHSPGCQGAAGAEFAGGGGCPEQRSGGNWYMVRVGGLM